jgi:hypothetical protein
MSIADVYIEGSMLGSGVAIAGFWTYLLATRRISGFIADRRIAAYHIAAEYLTAAMLIVAGIVWIVARDSSYARPLAGVALGLLVYALVGSPGLYADKRMLAVFITGGVCTVPAIVLVLARA